jgi:IS1 family transposase
MYRLSREKQLTILHMLVEGTSIRSAERMTRVHRDTIMRLLANVGDQCRTFLDRRMRNLNLDHLQVDEIWTFVLKKQRNILPADENEMVIGDQFLFVAFDEATKLIPSFVIGKRTAENARMLMQDLSERINVPGPLFRGERPQISTDGFPGYPNAVQEAFGHFVEYGVIVKNYAENESGRYAPPKITSTTRTVISGDWLQKRDICTSHVERNNLSIRTFIRRFTRLALGFSKKLENLAAAVSLYFAYYNFCWMHRSLTGTPAMAAGIAGHPWTLAELLSSIC